MLNRTEWTWLPCSKGFTPVKGEAFSKSQRITFPSKPAVAARGYFGVKATAETAAVCPRRLSICRSWATFQSTADRSDEAVNICSPFWLSESPSTAPACPV